MLLIDWEPAENFAFTIHPGFNWSSTDPTQIYTYAGAASSVGEKHPLSFYLGGGFERVLDDQEPLVGTLLTETILGLTDHWEVGFYTQWYPSPQSFSYILTAGANYYTEF